VPWSRSVRTAGLSAKAKDISQPAQCMSEASRPSASNSTNGNRLIRLPIEPLRAVIPSIRVIIHQSTSVARQFQDLSSGSESRSTVRFGIHLCLYPHLAHIPFIESEYYYGPVVQGATMA
jgi:hypothetical protein